MLRGVGKVSLMVRIRNFVCACMRRKLMDRQIREMVRPIRLGRFLCWCDRAR